MVLNSQEIINLLRSKDNEIRKNELLVLSVAVFSRKGGDYRENSYFTNY